MAEVSGALLIHVLCVLLLIVEHGYCNVINQLPPSHSTLQTTLERWLQAQVLPCLFEDGHFRHHHSFPHGRFRHHQSCPHNINSIPPRHFYNPESSMFLNRFFIMSKFWRGCAFMYLLYFYKLHFPTGIHQETSPSTLNKHVTFTFIVILGSKIPGHPSFLWTHRWLFLFSYLPLCPLLRHWLRCISLTICTTHPSSSLEWSKSPLPPAAPFYSQVSLCLRP